MLKLNDKRLMLEVFNYFYTTCNAKSKDLKYILQCIASNTPLPQNSYPVWLARQIVSMLKEQNISVINCIEHIDELDSLIVHDEDTTYLPTMPDIWLLQSLITTKTANPRGYISGLLWSINCDLQRYPDLLSETYCCSDFDEALFSNLDFDEVNNFYCRTLDERLLTAIQQDKPIYVIAYVPEETLNHTAMAQALAIEGIMPEALAGNALYQLLYRLSCIKDIYYLKNFHIGIFSSLTWLTASKSTIRDYFFQRFEPDDGFKFNVNNTNMVFTLWNCRKPRTAIKYELQLDDLGLSEDATEVIFKGRTKVKPTEATLGEWVKAKEMGNQMLVPSQTAPFSFGKQMRREPEDTLFHAFMTFNKTQQSGKTYELLAFPSRGSTAVTEDNLIRAIVTGAVLDSVDRLDIILSNAEFSAPDTELPDYDKFVANCLSLFLYSNNNHVFSYRDVLIDNLPYTRTNALFPLTISDCEKIITDEKLLSDMQSNPSNNNAVLELISTYVPKMDNVSKRLFEFSITKIIDSLKDTKRADIGYKNWLDSYDAGLMQIRSSEELWTEQDERVWLSLISQVRVQIRKDIYTYGFLTKED